MNEDLFKELFEKWWDDDPEDPDPDDVEVELFKTKAEYREMFHDFLSSYLEKSTPNYRELFKRYMTQVANREGLYFFDDTQGCSVWGPDSLSDDTIRRYHPDLQPEDAAAMEGLSQEILDYCRKPD